jgi:hypothetical protein
MGCTHRGPRWEICGGAAHAQEPEPALLVHEREGLDRRLGVRSLESRRVVTGVERALDQIAALGRYLVLADLSDSRSGDRVRGCSAQ